MLKKLLELKNVEAGAGSLLFFCVFIAILSVKRILPFDNIFKLAANFKLVSNFKID